MKCLPTVLLVAVVLAVAPVLAQPPGHIGNYCVPCHDKFSAEKPYASNLSLPVTNPKVTRIFPCYKSECHRFTSLGRWEERRYEMHINEKICKNCHAAKDGEFDIHSIHLKSENLINRTPVECKICHRTPEGYNSSIAHVPPYDNLYIAESTLMNTSIRVPPWNNDCGYCHPSVRGAKRLHDIHRPVIKKACPECHGESIESRSDLFVKVTGSGLPEKKDAIEKHGKSAIVQVFSNIFKEMAEYILKIMS